MFSCDHLNNFSKNQKFQNELNLCYILYYITAIIFCSILYFSYLCCFIYNIYISVFESTISKWNPEQLSTAFIRWSESPCAFDMNARVTVKTTRRIDTKDHVNAKKKRVVLTRTRMSTRRNQEYKCKQIPLKKSCNMKSILLTHARQGGFQNSCCKPQILQLTLSPKPGVLILHPMLSGVN